MPRPACDFLAHGQVPGRGAEAQATLLYRLPAIEG